MLRLILRQIFRRKAAVSLLLLFWIVSGYFLFTYSSRIFSEVVSWFTVLPGPGEQDPARAAAYVARAEDVIRDAGVDLSVMTRACREFLPRSYTRTVDSYRPDWLSRMERWRISGASSSGAQDDALAVPDAYWRANREITLSALKHLLDAQQYGYEISGRDRGEAAAPEILTPALIAQYSAAVCNDELGLMAWGDYVQFQEERAWNAILAARGDMDEYDAGPGEKRKLILEKLHGDPRYLRALREYSGGAPPDPRAPGACKAQDGLRLACLAPAEASAVYAKLIAVAPAEEIPRLRVNLAHTLVRQAQDAADPEPLLRQAIDELTIAALAREAESDAYFELARLHHQRGEFEPAYDALKQLQLLSRQPGFDDREFRRLARETLNGLGRFRDADCFAEMRDLSHGAREFCAEFVL